MTIWSQYMWVAVQQYFNFLTAYTSTAQYFHQHFAWHFHENFGLFLLCISKLFPCNILLHVTSHVMCSVKPIISLLLVFISFFPLLEATETQWGATAKEVCTSHSSSMAPGDNTCLLEVFPPLLFSDWCISKTPEWIAMWHSRCGDDNSQCFGESQSPLVPQCD